MKKTVLCVLLAAVLLLSACAGSSPATTEKPEAPATEQTNGTATGKATEKITENVTEAATEQPAAEPMERYFIFRIWNFTERNISTFKSIVDSVAETGFNAVKIHIPWHRVEAVEGEYDYSVFDQMFDYVINVKGMKAAVSVDFCRKSDGNFIPDEDLQKDFNGNITKDGPYYARSAISFCSDFAVNKAVEFYEKTVLHYDGLYGDKIILYLPAFSQYCETEYWCAAEYDYSDKAIAAFRAELAQNYTLEDFNKLTKKSYSSFDEVDPPSCSATDELGKLWYKFRESKLKAVIDKLAAAQKAACPQTKIAVQFGSVFDYAVLTRGTLDFVSLCENADILWVDDSPIYDHAFSMDYIRVLSDQGKEIAQEIDGPAQYGASKENYLSQGLISFEYGAKYLSIANWGIDDNYYAYEDVWKQIIGTWITGTPPEPASRDNEATLTVPLSKVFKSKGTQSYQSKYNKLLKTNNAVKIIIENDF